MEEGHNMPIRILISGASGRMGSMIAKGIAAYPHFVLAGETGRHTNLTTMIQQTQTDVVIDFTHPDTVFQNTIAIMEAGAHPVIGTTGLSLVQIQALQEQATVKKLGGIIAPNFSLGAILMIKYAQEIVKYLPHVEIIEMHHDRKADSPSGTALRTATLLAAANPAVQHAKSSTHENLPGARGANQQGIAIHAIRLPGLLAHQQIIFGTSGETLTLRHDTIDRECYMPGIALACEKVMYLDRLVYGLEEIL
jgi:4-hydroxy-tetrahydrodipicolinate reductase